MNNSYVAVSAEGFDQLIVTKNGMFEHERLENRNTFKNGIQHVTIQVGS